MYIVFEFILGEQAVLLLRHLMLTFPDSSLVLLLTINGVSVHVK